MRSNLNVPVIDVSMTALNINGKYIINTVKGRMGG